MYVTSTKIIDSIATNYVLSFKKDNNIKKIDSAEANDAKVATQKVYVPN